MKYGYSQLNSKVLDKKGRLRVARQMILLFKKHLGTRKLNELKVLDVGCSSGVISEYLVSQVGKVLGIDTDSYAIGLAKKNYSSKNLQFKVMDILENQLSKNNFNLIICNQVYYYTKKPEKVFSVIYRLLEPGGICYFTATNSYVTWIQREKSPMRRLSHKQLLNATKRFTKTSYTAKIITHSEEYGFRSLKKFRFILNVIPEWVWDTIEPLLPNMIWILEKPKR